MAFAFLSGAVIYTFAAALYGHRSVYRVYLLFNLSECNKTFAICIYDICFGVKKYEMRYFSHTEGEIIHFDLSPYFLMQLKNKT